MNEVDFDARDTSFTISFFGVVLVSFHGVPIYSGVSRKPNVWKLAVEKSRNLNEAQTLKSPGHFCTMRLFALL